MNNIYVVYNKEKETSESLNKLIPVLEKVGFKKECIKFEETEDFQRLVENKDFDFYAICINDTYPRISRHISEIYDLNIFDMMSKIYFNNDLNINLIGVVLDVSKIFENTYKRYVWREFTRIFDEYKKAETFSIPEDTFYETPEEVTEEVKIEEEIKPLEEESESNSSVLISSDIEESLNLVEEIKKLFKQFKRVEKLLNMEEE